MERERKKTKVLIGSLAAGLAAAILIAVGLGVQSAGRGKDLAASATALQENTDTLQKAQDALVEAKAEADALRAELETAKTALETAHAEKDEAVKLSAAELETANKSVTDLTAALDAAKGQLTDAQAEAEKARNELADAQAQLEEANAKLTEALGTKAQLEQKGAQDAESIEALKTGMEQLEAMTRQGAALAAGMGEGADGAERPPVRRAG